MLWAIWNLMHLAGNKRSAVVNKDLVTSIPLVAWQRMRNIRTQYGLALNAKGIGKIFMIMLPCDISVLKLFHVEQLWTPLDGGKNNVVVEGVPGKNKISWDILPVASYNLTCIKASNSLNCSSTQITASLGCHFTPFWCSSVQTRFIGILFSDCHESIF